jgi:uncharacterized protein (TIGR00730 family)
MRICVYCASSNKVDKAYFDATQKLAEDIAARGITLVYGGGSAGLMGCLADTVLKNNGQAIGILPRFMEKVEWGHKGLTQLTLVKDMHERKKLLIKDIDGVVALPGGCGTLEELMEVITLKRLGKFTKPIIILNTNGFYNHLKMLLDKMIKEHFMRAEHGEIYQFVNLPEEVIPAIENAPNWDSSAIKFAAV